MFRHDWEGAERELAKVSKLDDVPPTVRLDAGLLRALCASKRGDHRQAISLAHEATVLDEYSFVAAQYLVMSYLDAIADRRPSKSQVEISELAGIVSTVLASRANTEADREWLQTVQRLVNALTKENITIAE